MDKLTEARNKISAADKKIAELFEERMQAAADVAQYKKEHSLPIFDGKRENELIQKNTQYIKSEILKPYYVKFLKNTMDVSKDYQHMLLNGRKIAYSGARGAFANICAQKIFPDGRCVECGDFAAAYSAVETGECDCAVLPIENSYAGDVGAVMDLMFFGSLYVNGIYSLKISQNLLGVQGAQLCDIRTVISHPQALAQCDGYIKAHGFSKLEAGSTAEAAMKAAELSDKSIAAIAGQESSSLYGLTILDKDINESAQNSTRFAVLSRSEKISERNSGFMLFFTVTNEPGALAKAINIISGYGFNMKALKSRPLKDSPWQYYFYAEAEGNIRSADAEKMLKALTVCCKSAKCAGGYTEEVF